IGQGRSSEDVVHRMRLPGDRMVTAKHDLARANLRYEVAERLGGEHEGVEIELVEVFAWLLLQLDLGIAVSRRDETGVISARSIGREIAAAVRSNDLQAGKAVQRSLKDQVL